MRKVFRWFLVCLTLLATAVCLNAQLCTDLKTDLKDFTCTATNTTTTTLPDEGGGGGGTVDTTTTTIPPETEQKTLYTQLTAYLQTQKNNLLNYLDTPQPLPLIGYFTDYRMEGRYIIYLLLLAGLFTIVYFCRDIYSGLKGFAEYGRRHK